MPIQDIQKNVEWPGTLNNQEFGKWDELRKLLDTLYLGGPALTILLDSEDELRNAQASVSSYGATQKSKKFGWMYQTTSRGIQLYVRKVRRRS